MNNYDWRPQHGLVVGYAWFYNAIRYLRRTPPEFSGVFPLPVRTWQPNPCFVWCVLA
jgi:hypothetical protein